jgi:hypothetical protein
MNKTTLSPSHFYTRRDVGGPIYSLLNGIFRSFLLLVALDMTVFAFLILIVNYTISPLLSLISRILLSLPTRNL